MCCLTTIHSAAFLIMQSPFKAMTPRQLTNLLYIAERQHAKDYGTLFSRDDRISTLSGPAHKDIYDYSQCGINNPILDGHFELRSEASLISLRPCLHLEDLDYLSDAIIETIMKVWKDQGAKSEDELLAWIKNNCPEWNFDNEGNIITIKRLFTGLGIDHSNELAEEAEDQNRINHIMNYLQNT